MKWPIFTVAFVFSTFTSFGRLRPEAEVSAQVEGALAAEVNSVVLDSLEHLVQVLDLTITVIEQLP